VTPPVPAPLSGGTTSLPVVPPLPEGEPVVPLPVSPPFVRRGGENGLLQTLTVAIGTVPTSPPPPVLTGPASEPEVPAAAGAPAEPVPLRVPPADGATIVWQIQSEGQSVSVSQDAAAA